MEFNYDRMADSIVDLLMVTSGTAQMMQDLRDEAPDRLAHVKDVIAGGLRVMIEDEPA